LGLAELPKLAAAGYPLSAVCAAGCCRRRVCRRGSRRGGRGRRGSRAERARSPSAVRGWCSRCQPRDINSGIEK
jgi:hypothetical protein